MVILFIISLSPRVLKSCGIGLCFHNLNKVELFFLTGKGLSYILSQPLAVDQTYYSLVALSQIEHYSLLALSQIKHYFLQTLGWGLSHSLLALLRIELHSWPYHGSSIIHSFTILGQGSSYSLLENWVNLSQRSTEDRAIFLASSQGIELFSLSHAMDWALFSPNIATDRALFSPDWAILSRSCQGSSFYLSPAVDWALFSLGVWPKI